MQKVPLLNWIGDNFRLLRKLFKHYLVLKHDIDGDFDQNKLLFIDLKIISV